MRLFAINHLTVLDRIDQSSQEAKCERHRGQDQETSQTSGFELGTPVAQHVGALPTKLSRQLACNIQSAYFYADTLCLSWINK